MEDKYLHWETFNGDLRKLFCNLQKATSLRGAVILIRVLSCLECKSPHVKTLPPFSSKNTTYTTKRLQLKKNEYN